MHLVGNCPHSSSNYPLVPHNLSACVSERKLITTDKKDKKKPNDLERVIEAKKHQSSTKLVPFKDDDEMCTSKNGCEPPRCARFFWIVCSKDARLFCVTTTKNLNCFTVFLT